MQGHGVPAHVRLLFVPRHVHTLAAWRGGSSPRAAPTEDRGAGEQCPCRSLGRPRARRGHHRRAPASSACQHSQYRRLKLLHGYAPLYEWQPSPASAQGPRGPFLGHTYTTERKGLRCQRLITPGQNGGGAGASRALASATCPWWTGPAALSRPPISGSIYAIAVARANGRGLPYTVVLALGQTASGEIRFDPS